MLTTVNVHELQENWFKALGTDWALLTAGTFDRFNTMTVSWGGVGILWNKPVCFVFVRPQRYTYEFIESHQFFNLCFFPDGFRDALSYCGSISGRDSDKIKKCGLTPTIDTAESIYYEEARLVVECKKLYYQDIQPDNFLDSNIEALYNNDYHRMYVGEIKNCLKKTKD